MATDEPTHLLTVSLSDTQFAEERGAVLSLLEENRERRKRAVEEVDAARKQLSELLLRGHAAGMEVAHMATSAGISRDTAHRTLKDAGSLSWKRKQDFAAEAMRHIKAGTFQRNKFRMLVNMLLLKALGRNPENVPRSVAGVIDFAANEMRRDDPGFIPEFDEQILLIPWPVDASG
jgi:hypothetical protein